MEKERASFISSRVSGRTEYTISREESNKQTRCISLLKPFLIWKVLATLIIVIIYIVDLTSGNSKYSCQQSGNEHQGTNGELCVESFLSVGITIAIIIVEIIVTIPRFPFLLVPVCRVFQIAGILILKVIIQQQLYHHFISHSFSPAYYGYAMLCGLVLGDMIGDNRGRERKHLLFTILFMAVVMFGLMLAEILVNKYQTDLILVDLVLIYGPVGLILMVMNTILFNCFTTVLEHNLDPYTIAMVIISAPLTYVLVGISKIPPDMITLVGVVVTGVLIYFATYAAWSLTLTKSHERCERAILNTVQVVRLQKASSHRDSDFSSK